MSAINPVVPPIETFFEGQHLKAKELKDWLAGHSIIYHKARTHAKQLDLPEEHMLLLCIYYYAAQNEALTDEAIKLYARHGALV